MKTPAFELVIPGGSHHFLVSTQQIYRDTPLMTRIGMKVTWNNIINDFVPPLDYMCNCLISTTELAIKVKCS